MERRKLTASDIDKVRNIEGFPIAKDEDQYRAASKTSKINRRLADKTLPSFVRQAP
jgi:hypothetical protein